MTAYRLVRVGSLRPLDGLERRPLVGAGTGAQHVDLTWLRLAPAAGVPAHRHAFEQSLFMLDGLLVLTVDGQRERLGPGDGAFVPVGCPHACATDGAGATWVEVGAPAARTRPPADSWPLADAPPLRESGAGSPGRFRDGGDARPERPTDALLVFGGTTIRMLVDARLGAALHTLFTVRFEPGAALAGHDHPFEEAYLVLEGRIDAICEGERLTLAAGDALWTGVGCIHGFENPYDAPVRWLEAQAPQPPARYGFRFLEP
jgi:quercetin dioxygenase-like cupin family protein